MKVGSTLRWIMLFSLIAGDIVLALENGNFQPPSLDGYDYVGSMPYDRDEDGIKESPLTMYKNSQGDKILKIKTDGKEWDWSKKSHKYPHDKNDISKNYTILDTDCNGVFDTKYDLETEYDFPTCLKNNNSNE